MSLFRLSAAIIVIFAILNSRSIAIASEESEYICFLVTSSGKVVNLSDALCKSKELRHTDSKKDLAYIEAYKVKAMKYTDVRDNLIANIQRDPQEKVEQARNVCVDLKAGISMDEIAEDRLEENGDRASQVNTLIINSLAAKFYCNNF